jgi:hypothetical protein
MKSIRKSYFLLFVVLFLILIGQRNAAAEGGWFLSIYGGQVADNNEWEILTFRPDFVDSYITAFVVGKELWSYKDYVLLEAEGQVVKHSGKQDHEEFNAVLVLRWLPFPWDDYIDTSFAIGDGISYATEDPEIEEDKLDETSKVLNYLMVELTFGVPKLPHWSVFARLHHRSGIFGLIDGVSGGLNAVGGGVRYSF